MAVTLADSDCVKRVTNDATAGDVTKITLPPGTVGVMLLSVGGVGMVTHTGTDAAAIGAEYAEFPADTWFTLGLNRYWGGSGSPDVFIAHASNAGVTVVVPVRP